MNEGRRVLRRALLAGAVAALLIGAFGIGALAPWRVSPGDWHDVKPGMTYAEVEAILGKPDFVLGDSSAPVPLPSGKVGVPVESYGYYSGETDIYYVYFANGVVDRIVGP
jgi:hypothetical protein